MPKPRTPPTIEQLLTGDPQAVADNCCMPVVWTDHQATRRQRIHGCNAPGETNCFASTHINEVLQHLIAAGWTDAVLICQTPSRTYLAAYITFEALEQQNRPRRIPQEPTKSPHPG